MTRVLIADDHPLMLAGIDGLLANTAFEIVARLTDGNEALNAILSLKPDIALIDNSMPGLNGVEIIREARSAGSYTRFVLLTAHLDDDDLLDAMHVGVDGIVLKDDGARLLINCLEHIAAGARWIPREITNRAVIAAQAREDDPLNQLSSRELEVAQLAAQGLRNRAIADECGLTEGSVKVYLNRIFEKLDVSSRTELAVMIGKSV